MHSIPQKNKQKPSQWVRGFIDEQIQAGVWKPGDFLPSENALAEKLGVHRLTVNGVLKELVREGQVERRRGVGTVLRDRTEDAPTGRQTMVGLVFHHHIDLHSNPFYAQICEVLRKRLFAEGYFMLPLGSADELLANHSAEANRIRLGLAGYIFMGPVSKDRVEEIRTADQPAIFVGFSEGTPDAINISSDDEKDSAKLTRKIIELGHHRILHINARLPYRMQSKLNGFLTAMEEADLEVPFRYITEAEGLESEDGYAAMKEFCKLDLPFTAVYGGNDLLARGAMDYLQEIGKDIPTEVSVVGFDGIAPDWRHPRLTTMAVDRARMGREAAVAMLSLLHGTPQPPRQVLLPSRFEPGESLAAALSPLT